MKRDTQHNALKTVMLRVTNKPIMLILIMLNVVMLNVVMLSVNAVSLC